MKLGWRGALGILISAACLYYVFHGVPWRAFASRVEHANLWLLTLAAIASTCMFPLRARRWRTILDPVAPKLPFGPLWRSTAIGAMITNVVPGRAGELARPFAVSREVPLLPFSTALASIAVDRIFDAIVVFALLAIGILAPDFPRGASFHGQPIGRYAAGAAVLPVLLLVALYSLVFLPEVAIRIFEIVVRRVSPAIEARGRDALRSFAAGLSVLKAPVHFVAVMWWTLLHWLLQPLAFWLGLKAFGVDVSWSALLVLQGVIVLAVSLPSSPGFFGPFELGAKIALAFYGIRPEVAATWAIAFHVVSFIPITIFGAIYFARLGLHLSDLGGASKASAAR